MEKKILVVEDDWELNQSICYMLDKEGYDVLATGSLAEAEKIYKEKGAEDYVTKPFSMKILMKKIGVILKRSGDEAGESGNVYDDGYLRIDFARARVEKDGTDCMVTPTEYRILQEFIAHKGQLLTYQVLLERLWDGGSQFVDKHALAVNINRLRNKIENEEHRYISNVYGMGYQWLG